MGWASERHYSVDSRVRSLDREACETSEATPTHGQDRTGEVVKEFRVDDDGWTKQAAYNEMRAHHYHPELHGLYERWENYQPPKK